MTIGNARKFLIKWLGDRIRIDRWGLSLPDSVEDDTKPKSIGLDKPSLNLEITSSEGWGEDKVCTIKTTIPFQIIYRFSSNLEYSQIPRADAEDVLAKLLIEAKDHNCFPEYFLSVSPSGSVSVAEIKNGDQLLVIEIDFDISIQSSINPISPIFR